MFLLKTKYLKYPMNVYVDMNALNSMKDVSQKLETSSIEYSVLC